MSTDWASVLAAFSVGDDPKKLELIENIVAKTELGKIPWEKTPSTLVANVPGMQLSFVRSSASAWSILGGSSSGWDIFSIRNQQGSEIMKLEQPLANFWAMTPPNAPPPAPPPRSKLLQAVDTLYAIAETKGQVGEIDKAINVIKSL
jgi:hypothetical protein